MNPQKSFSPALLEFNTLTSPKSNILYVIFRIRVPLDCFFEAIAQGKCTVAAASS